MPAKIIDKPKVALESANFLNSACYSIKNQSIDGINLLENYLKEIDSFSFPDKYFGKNPDIEVAVNNCLASLRRHVGSKNYASACSDCKKISDVLNQAGSQIVRKILGLPSES